MRETPKESKWVAACCLAILLAIYVVGAMNHGVLRPIVQTLPLWVPIVLGFRGSEFAKWSALPCLIIWLVTMVLIWLFGVAWVYVALGQFSLTDLAMTLIVAVASARWVLLGSSLAYSGTSVRGEHCSSSVRRAAVFGTLGRSIAFHPPLILLGIRPVSFDNYRTGDLLIDLLYQFCGVVGSWFRSIGQLGETDVTVR